MCVGHFGYIGFIGTNKQLNDDDNGIINIIPMTGIYSK